VRFLLDTNVLSELRKGERCNPNVARWFAELPDEAVLLSVLSVGEIRRGIENVRRRDPPAAAALQSWLSELVKLHTDRILPIDLEVAQHWGYMGVPDPVPVLDGLIGATAKAHGLTVATRNTEDIARTGVAVFNPFAP